MPYDPEQHRRRSIRLKGYDYSRAGAYFVTAVAQGRACLFGDVVDNDMILNDAGRMVERWWWQLNDKFPTIVTDAYIVMPNHFHGIIVIVGADSRVRPDPDPRVRPDPDPRVRPDPDPRVRPDPDPRVRPDPDPRTTAGGHVVPPLPTIVQWFKTMTTNEYIRGVKQLGWPAFAGKLWQRNYFEHIVRDEQALERIRGYISGNPQRWSADEENPNRAR
jgi:putative transposase